MPPTLQPNVQELYQVSIASSATYDSSSLSSKSSPRPSESLFGPIGQQDRRVAQSELPKSSPIMSQPSSAIESYPQSVGSASASPGGRPLGFPEPMSALTSEQSGASSHISPGHQSQKRAYRQRRKDPSCDACRERKVKCDATDMTSCSECTSRNVKCQFTKETNRRMSSIKQVQDLEKQLSQAKQQIHHLRATLKGTPMDIDATSGADESVNFSSIDSSPQRRQREPTSHDLPNVRRNLLIHASGIFKPPLPYRSTQHQQPTLPTTLPTLPVKLLADHILHQYYSTVHHVFPVLHWPTFHQEFEAIYKVGTLQGVPPAWGATLFAVLACGVMHTRDPSINRLELGKEYVAASQSLLDIWHESYNIEHARAILLTSMFLFEINLKSTAWIWLGTCVRIAQVIHLNFETGPYQVIEGEMRRRVWWCIYNWDRLISLELGRPFQINDHDCDISLPYPVDDHYILDSGALTSTDPNQPSNPLVPVINLMRTTSRFYEDLESSPVSSNTLRTFDAHYASMLASLLPESQLHSSTYLDPRTLLPLTFVFNARILLHRHNLSPAATVAQRSQALDAGVAAAKRTCHLLTRCMRPSPSDQRWEQLLASTATGLLCTHLWRCSLLLCFRAYYTEALICVQSLTAIGSQCVINEACGRHLLFFLSELVLRLKRGDGDALDSDEDMIAYVSADLQASKDGNWVWPGREPIIGVESIDSVHHRKDQTHSHSHGHGLPFSESRTREWLGWAEIMETLEKLRKQQGQPEQWSGKGEQDTSQSPRPPPQPSPRSTSRISIASII